jgi:hypothetical protein
MRTLTAQCKAVTHAMSCDVSHAMPCRPKALTPMRLETRLAQGVLALADAMQDGALPNLCRLTMQSRMISAGAVAMLEAALVRDRRLLKVREPTRGRSSRGAPRTKTPTTKPSASGTTTAQPTRAGARRSAR